MKENFYQVFFKLKGLGHNKESYNNTGFMDWLDEKNNLTFYSYITDKDLNHIKHGLNKEILVASFHYLEEAKQCMEKRGGIPAGFFLKVDGRHFYQTNINFSKIKKIDKAYADFLVDRWTVFTYNFTKLEIIKIKSFEKNSLKNIKLKTKKI